MTSAHRFVADEVVHTDPHVVHKAPTWGEAANARLAWEAAVDQLVQPGQHRVHREDGSTETAEVLPLLRQVEEAVLPSGTKTSGKTLLGSRPPASLGALALLAEIRAAVRGCCRTHGHTSWSTLNEQLRAWVAHADHWQIDAADYVLWAAEQATRWVQQARLVVDPEPRFPLRGKACPTCGVDVVQVWSDDQNDHVRRPALYIDPDQADAVCAACGLRWPLDVWIQLNTMAQQQLTHETLAVTGITHDDDVS
ncbi:hypothetical protein BBK82_10650 [Lentzea guizhouensis]|uniref:Uncharacterized protein n=1 Tax=Lentzea guizhouensis TaxID=1586287 RepID=A0A1B2HFI7_9PSEU|nr:hypothetical protein [Lentzea guizhouensis]ANZ36456.1 hypothetical protein BBK82_10650 [Lentzea guizhouensis]